MRLGRSVELNTWIVVRCDLCEKEIQAADIPIAIEHIPGTFFDLCDKCANKIPFTLREMWQKAEHVSGEDCRKEMDEAAKGIDVTCETPKIPKGWRGDKTGKGADDPCETLQKGSSITMAIDALNMAGFDVSEYKLDKWTKEYHLVIKAQGIKE